ncbi:hypothetical protein C9374_003744 [Naegleria lovaniensis]|uniref:Endonuclease III homolog n=1 Tax=Naegleria lovaniensis TaxID=51637 RepID=A0AA88GZT1_NAELO|nr:uncharacterized protein C9374_003744 [Naegleria lovaniensis]KAG2393980.1 hypothetical protein C9374_003744 [Naegleria lovaniensis]
MLTRKRKKSMKIEKAESDDHTTFHKSDEIIAIEDLYITSSSSVCSSSCKKNNSEFMKQFKMEYNLIKEYRMANLNAPVDTMGCASLSDKDADEKVQRFQILVSLMLSSQTKDEITAKAIKKLKDNNALSVSQMDELSEQEIQNLIYPVGFYKRKATYLKKVCKILKEKYDSDIPNDVKGLQSLPGVGPKMAYLCMSTAWKQVEGIGVDTHVHRISNRLGWVHTETPEQTRKELESFLERDEWDVINHMLVGFGQTICKPIGPKCLDCIVNKTCQYYHSNKDKKSPKKKVKKEEEDLNSQDDQE